jgi:tRNA modification GTPase
VTATGTYAACLTPAGTAAIATLAVRGPRAWEVVRQLFRTGGNLPSDPLATDHAGHSGRFWLGQLGDETADEVVLVIKRGVPTPWLELHCHGGREVVRMLLEALQRHGISICSWQELEELTAEKPARAAAAAALAQAPTLRTAGILLDQYHGAFEQAVRAIRAHLERGATEEARPHLQALAQSAAVGRHLITPWRVVIAGAPNVGKSSLVNALAGYARSVVAATPGTTRDLVTTLTALDGWPVDLVDTAGLRDGGGTLEAAGIQLAREALTTADLVVWVLDAGTDPVWPSFPLDRLHVIVNKIDLPRAWELGHVEDAVHVSARTGAGVPELTQRLAHWLVPDPPPPGAAVPFTAALCDRVAEAWCHFETGELDETHRILRAITSEAEDRGPNRNLP